MNRWLLAMAPLRLTSCIFALKDRSSNKCRVDSQGLIDGRPQIVKQTAAKNAEDQALQLFRIGAAVSARNSHTAIYDELRLLKDI